MDSVGIWAAFIGSATALTANSLRHFFGRFVYRAKRKEEQRNSDLIRIEAVVFEIRDIAVMYWDQSGAADKQAVRAGAIVGRLTFIFSLIDELFSEQEYYRKRVNVAATKFHEACTSGEFQVRARSSDPERSRSIETEAYALVHLTAKLRRQLPKSYFYSD